MLSILLVVIAVWVLWFVYSYITRDRESLKVQAEQTAWCWTVLKQTGKFTKLHIKKQQEINKLHEVTAPTDIRAGFRAGVLSGYNTADSLGVGRKDQQKVKVETAAVSQQIADLIAANNAANLK